MRQAGLIALAIMLASGAFAQEQHFSENVAVGYVMVPFTVFGPHNAPLTDIHEKDVELFVDGVRVKSDLFEASMNAPVSYTILLDGSGSMGLAGKMGRPAPRSMPFWRTGRRTTTSRSTCSMTRKRSRSSRSRATGTPSPARCAA
jgi:hypothetical protein